MNMVQSYLERQADKIERVLWTHRAPGRITGGTVGPRLIRLFFRPEPHVKVSTIKAAHDNLALAMQIPASTLRLVGPTGEGIVVEFPNPKPRPVTLLQILDCIDKWQPGMALLGLSDEGVPLLLRITSPEVPHVLIAGTTGSGKSELQRTIVTSMVLTQSARDVQFILIDPKARPFRIFQNAPHVIRYLTTVNEIVEALRSVVLLMEHRDERHENSPLIIMVIDELADLIFQAGDQVETPLMRLVQRGREAGIHVIAATQRPSSAVLSGLLKANFPLRLVGKVVSLEDARVAAGQYGTGAERLIGRGDFLAVAGDGPVRFQAAYISELDLTQALAALCERQIPTCTQNLPETSFDMLHTTPVTQTSHDVDLLIAQMRRAGRMWASAREAERWIFGQNRGGIFWDRTRSAIEFAIHQGLVESPTTTTKNHGLGMSQTETTHAEQ